MDTGVFETYNTSTPTQWHVPVHTQSDQSLLSLSTFVSSLTAIGSVIVMVLVGAYCARAGFLDPYSTKILSRLSVNVFIPCILFTSIPNCAQGFAANHCPSLSHTIREAWPLLLLPTIYVAIGSLVGLLLCLVFVLPRYLWRAAIGAVCFANSTGLPITLLSVLRASFAHREVPPVNPSLLLSVYLLTYPLLQWTYGGYLMGMFDRPAAALSPAGEAGSESPREHAVALSSFGEPVLEDENPVPTDSFLSLPASAVARNSHLNLLEAARLGRISQGGSMLSLGRRFPAASLYSSLPMSSFVGPEFDSLSKTSFSFRRQRTGIPDDLQEALLVHTDGEVTSDESVSVVAEPAAISSHLVALDAVVVQAPSRFRCCHDFSCRLCVPLLRPARCVADWVYTATAPIHGLLSAAFQPAVIAVLVGMFVAIIPPLRSIVVDMEDGDGNAPLEWLFEGLSKVGSAVVPINLLILGATLYFTFQLRVESYRFPIAVLLGRMVIMPFVGYGTAQLLRRITHISPEVSTSYLLVAMIVTATPTSNSLIVMTGIGTTEAHMATQRQLGAAMLLQVLSAPLFLTVSLGIFMHNAQQI